MHRLQLAVLHLYAVLLVAAVTCAASQPATSSSSPGDAPTGVDVHVLFSTPEGRRHFDDMQLAPFVAACVACVVGLVLCSIGSRVLRYVALGCAFLDGAFGTAAILETMVPQAEWQGVVSWTCFFLGGIFCCLLVVTIARADVLWVGITAGLITACTSLTTFGYLLAPNHPDVVLYGMLVVFGLGMGLLTLKTQPLSVIAATSWIGSNMVTWGIGYFVGEYPNATTISKFQRASDGAYDLPIAWYAYVAGAVALCLLGIGVQTRAVASQQNQSRGTRPTELLEMETRFDNCRGRGRGRGQYTSVQTPSRNKSTPSRSSTRPTTCRGVHHIV